jgi:uncharacterized protein YggE
MKRKWSAVFGVVAVVGIIGLAGCSSGGGAREIGALSFNSQQEGIVVNGQGKATAVPDIATLRVGVEAQQATVAAAQEQAAGAMDRVTNSLKSNGVEAKDIQTQSFSITKVSRFDDKTQQEVVLGYRVSNVVQAKIRAIDKVGEIIDAAAVAGGDLIRIDGINFSVEDPTTYYTQARTAAMNDAKTKASQLADLAGVGLGKATFISENTFLPVPAQPVFLERAGLAADVSTPISPGELEIQTSVQVTFAIR